MELRKRVKDNSVYKKTLSNNKTFVPLSNSYKCVRRGNGIYTYLEMPEKENSIIPFTHLAKVEYFNYRYLHNYGIERKP